MKRLLSMLVLVCSGHGLAWGQTQNGASPVSPPASSDTVKAAPAISGAQENDHQAKTIIDQAIEALGGKTYLTIRDREQQGRAYSFHHGRPNGEGALFWSFTEFPDKERVEVTKERDIAELYVGNKAWEITYKGPHPIEQKDLDDYLRRRRFSLDTILRTWVNDPGVVLLYEGAAIAAQHPAAQVTLINALNESVTLYFDADSHLPIKKSFSWRDPVDRQKNIEEEVYDDYKPVAGIMAPYNLTRYFNGDMASQRFLHEVTINQGLDQAMFDPNSHYNPNKTTGKQGGKR
ncbi:MAG TPA: hypothetical protein VFL34_17265 [Candidatus Sulfotelmatobacter sp.]|nr:hypothetical protein [Candidatus Sulfotelmatobacter sp.]